ncbi:MAG: patatin-like phospholipase family protein [Spirochaetes bacterium]|nr:patatin-like phospholipase family protein [Spirochaetota bacterium]
MNQVLGRINRVNSKISLVLSGGGARGIAHIGVIEELEKQGLEIASVAGTSMGALVGGVYALGKMEEFKQWVFSLNKRKIFNLIDFSFSLQGLIKGDKVLNKMKKFIADKNIEDLKIAYSATATDLINKKEVVFTKGSIYEAIRSSISIPTVFTPVKKENTLLIDGGIINNIPINNAKRVPGDLLIVVNVGADVEVLTLPRSKEEARTKQSLYQKKIKNFYKRLQKKNSMSSKEEQMGYFDLINTTISLMMDNVSQISLKQNPPDILINISRDTCSTFDFFRAEELVEIGRYAAVKSLDKFNSAV